MSNLPPPQALASFAPTPRINAGWFVDTYELAFGDPLELRSVQDSSVYFRFPSHTSVTLHQKKITSSTAINGRNGTIKEISGIDDWEVEIETEILTVAYSTSSISLLSNIRKVLSLFRDQGKVSVLNDRLSSCGIEYLMIQDIDLPDNMYHSQKIRIKALSDHDYNMDYFQEPDAYSSEAAGSTGGLA